MNYFEVYGKVDYSAFQAVGLSFLVDKNVLYIEGNGPSAKYKRK